MKKVLVAMLLMLNVGCAIQIHNNDVDKSESQTYEDLAKADVDEVKVAGYVLVPAGLVWLLTLL
jgi:predicted urease superfamily metal-dependent hydrolase